MASASISPSLKLDKLLNTVAAFDVALAGFVLRQDVEIEFVETDGTGQEQNRKDRVMGSVKGKVASTASVAGAQPAQFSFIPTEPPPPLPKSSDKPSVAFTFKKPEPLDPNPQAPPPPPPIYVFDITADNADVNEGDFWGFMVRVKATIDDQQKTLASQVVPIARVRRQLGRTMATYDWHSGHEMTLFHDGSTDGTGTDGAFKQMLDAINGAQKLILVVDWSFQPLMCPSRQDDNKVANSIGALLINKAAGDQNMLVAIHTWAHTDIGAPDKENDHGKAVLEHIAKGMGKPQLPKNLYWRATSREGIGYSHHQKFVVVDVDGAGGKRDLRVFFGGLDLTKGRFDWPGHTASNYTPSGDDDWTETQAMTDRFVKTWGTADGTWTTDDWYNAELALDGHVLHLPRQPWHDIHATIKGAAAWDFVREFVGRWNRVPSIGGNDGDTGDTYIRALWDWYRTLRANRKDFVQQSTARTGPWIVQVYRSQTRAHWAPPKTLPPNDDRPPFDDDFDWTIASDPELSIQDAYRQAIDQAERFIYIENQYFIGSGARWGSPSIANDIPERLLNKILERDGKKKDFHVYVVTPMFPEGDPSSLSIQEVRRNAWETMKYMATTLQTKLKAAGSDKLWGDYLSFFFLAKWQELPQKRWNSTGDRKERVRSHQRYMVYVHSKFAIVDDRWVILGSANLNERSQAGNRDSEIACGLWPGPGQDQDGVDEIKAFRRSLWQEHFGKSPDNVDNPESGDCVSSVASLAGDNYVDLREMKAPAGQICTWPVTITRGVFGVDPTKGRGPEAARYIPDAPPKASWEWQATGSWLIRRMDVAE
jgi:phospholipase D1/2